MPRPDLFRAFQELGPEEQRCILRWAEEIGADLEAIPPLRALIVAVAVAREAEEREGTEDARYREAASRLQAGDGDSILRKVRYWRNRPGKTFSAPQEVAREIGSGRSTAPPPGAPP